MRRFFRWAFGYAIAAMGGGVLYREITKLNSFTGQCALGFVHGHLLALGMLGFLVIALLEYHLHITEARTYRPFMYCYNLGIIVTAGMLGVRGWVQIYNLPDNAAISGIAGAGHILLAIGIILLFCALFERSKITQEAVPERK